MAYRQSSTPAPESLTTSGGAPEDVDALDEGDDDDEGDDNGEGDSGWLGVPAAALPERAMARARKARHATAKVHTRKKYASPNQTSARRSTRVTMGQKRRSVNATNRKICDSALAAILLSLPATVGAILSRGDRASPGSAVCWARLRPSTWAKRAHHRSNRLE